MKLTLTAELNTEYDLFSSPSGRTLNVRHAEGPYTVLCSKSHLSHPKASAQGNCLNSAMAEENCAGRWSIGHLLQQVLASTLPPSVPNMSSSLSSRLSRCFSLAASLAPSLFPKSVAHNF